ncbi:MAG: hypothetical protein ACYS0G_16000 [Planctomycetota bacterium]
MFDATSYSGGFDSKLEKGIEMVVAACVGGQEEEPMHKFTMLLGAVALLATTVMATAGPAWVEPDDDDAGSLPEEAQVTSGGDLLITISGSLDGDVGAAGQPDFEDMFLIRIVDPLNFSATTAFLPGSTEFDSRLYLFEFNGALVTTGLGLLGNEDTGGPLPGGLGFMALGDILVGACCFPDGDCQVMSPGGCGDEGGIYQGDGTDCSKVDCPVLTGACCIDEVCFDMSFPDCDKSGGIYLGDGTSCDDAVCPNPEGSTMGNASTDGFPSEVTEEGLYLLAITVTPRQPISPDGAIFFIPPGDTTEVSGPDGPGGNLPITDWQAPVPRSSWAAPSFGRARDVPGEYTILLTGVAFAQPEELELALDIRPGGCPNPLSRGSGGVLPVSILGTADFDVSSIDLATVVMSRADGAGGSVAPHAGPPGPHAVIDDTGTPFDGEPCDCHGLGGDGIDDLSVKFKTQQMVAALELDGLPEGAEVELVVSGALLDGTLFVARDCIWLVPPH